MTLTGHGLISPCLKAGALRPNLVKKTKKTVWRKKMLFCFFYFFMKITIHSILIVRIRHLIRTPREAFWQKKAMHQMK